MLGSALGFLIDVVFGLFTYALLLRFVMQVLRAPFRNPAGQAVMALTDWIVKPLRKILPGFKGIDWASLLATYLFQVLWLSAYYVVFGKGFSLLGIGAAYLLAVAALALVKTALWLLIGVVLVQAVLSWVSPYHPVAPFFDALAKPLLRPVQKAIPPIGGVDITPVFVLIFLQLLLMLPVTWLEMESARMLSRALL